MEDVLVIPADLWRDTNERRRAVGQFAVEFGTLTVGLGKPYVAVNQSRVGLRKLHSDAIEYPQRRKAVVCCVDNVVAEGHSRFYQVISL